MIHVLRRGVPVCGFELNPRVWPAGVSWVRVEDADKATCENCREVLEWDALPTVALAPEDICTAEVVAHSPQVIPMPSELRKVLDRGFTTRVILVPDGDDD